MEVPFATMRYWEKGQVARIELLEDTVFCKSGACRGYGLTVAPDPHPAHISVIDSSEPPPEGNHEINKEVEKALQEG